MSDDTPESLHARIQEVEHTLYPEALEKVLREIRDS
jgi:folate-dependent phosphoribosylglycinamide formyltransferase PurN